VGESSARRPTQAEIHKAGRRGWKQTSRAWLQDHIRAAIPCTTSAEELLAYLQAGDIPVKPRRAPSGDLLGYAVGRLVLPLRWRGQTRSVALTRHGDPLRTFATERVELRK
jgi:hypothetical protein